MDARARVGLDAWIHERMDGCMAFLQPTLQLVNAPVRVAPFQLALPLQPGKLRETAFLCRGALAFHAKVDGHVVLETCCDILGHVV